jgi:hypothetical protein
MVGLHCGPSAWVPRVHPFNSGFGRLSPRCARLSFRSANMAPSDCVGAPLRTGAITLNGGEDRAPPAKGATGNRGRASTPIANLVSAAAVEGRAWGPPRRGEHAMEPLLPPRLGWRPIGRHRSCRTPARCPSGKRRRRAGATPTGTALARSASASVPRTAGAGDGSPRGDRAPSTAASAGSALATLGYRCVQGAMSLNCGEDRALNGGRPSTPIANPVSAAAVEGRAWKAASSPQRPFAQYPSAG